MREVLQRGWASVERAAANRRRPRVAVLGEPSGRAASLQAEAVERGWQVVGLPAGPDLVVAFEIPTDARAFATARRSIAIVTPESERRWIVSGALDGADQVIADTETSRHLLEAGWATELATTLAPQHSLGEHLLGDQAPSLRVGIATCAPTWDAAPGWGDTYFARALSRGFRRAGWQATELTREDWYGEAAERCDVVIHLRGLARRRPRRSQTNLLWVISHPERVSDDECANYDVVAVASQPFAETLTSRTGRPVHAVLQGADRDTFRLAPQLPGLADEVAYVGNARWPRRTAPRWLLRAGQPFRLTGSGWEGLPERSMLAEQFLPNRELARLYRSAAVVVADHHGSMRDEGFVANRIFDVLAAGGNVIADDVAGIDQLFEGTVRTYSSQETLSQLVGQLKGDANLRSELAWAGHRLVRAHHTLDHRVATLISLITAERND